MAARSFLILAGTLIIAGCAADSAKTDTLRTAPVEPKSGNVVALWMRYRDSNTTSTRLEPVLVPGRYAAFINWPNPQYSADAVEKRLFLFYDNVQKKYWRTRDYEQFLKVIAQQPRDIEVLQIETCTVARCYMPNAEWKRLEAAMASRDIRWAKDPNTNGPMHFCYCESVGDFVYPGDAP